MNFRQSLQRLRQYLSHGRPTPRHKKPSCQLDMEALEDRTVPSATLYLDFGFGFPDENPATNTPGNLRVANS